MELEVLGTFYFVLCYKISYFGKVAMLMTLIFFDIPHQVIQLISLAACIKKSSGYILDVFIILWKRNACRIIWRRPRRKIHIRTTQMWFKINFLELSLVEQHKINSYFILHLWFKLTPPTFEGLIGPYAFKLTYSMCEAPPCQHETYSDQSIRMEPEFWMPGLSGEIY